jgi:ATP phosphoribosyltransferase regulatory subunit
MSKSEKYELYLRNKDFLISDSILTFTDPAGRLMALKPDVTLSIVKNLREGGLQRLYYHENVYRVPKGSQEAKEIMQVGLECIGDVDAYCEYEVLYLAVRSLALLGQPFVLSLSHLGIVRSVIECCGFTGSDAQSVLSWIGEKNVHELTEFCIAHGIDERSMNALTFLVRTYGPIGEVLPALRDGIGDFVEKTELDAFIQLGEALSETPYSGSVRIDFSVMNDIRYYNGLVFQGYLRNIPDGILSGGQYDLLMEKMGKSSRALGFAVYLDLLERLEKSGETMDADVLVLYGKDTPLNLVREEVDRQTADGRSVIALKEIPEGIRCRETVRIDGERRAPNA